MAQVFYVYSVQQCAAHIKHTQGNRTLTQDRDHSVRARLAPSPQRAVDVHTQPHPLADTTIVHVACDLTYIVPSQKHRSRLKT